MRAASAIATGMMKELMRRKDFYVLLIFMLVLLGLMASQSFFQLEGVTRYIRDIGYTLVMLFSFVIAVTFSAKQIPSEIESRTVYPLLAKPLSRLTVILGKFTGSMIVSLISFSLYFGVYLIFYLTETEKGSPALLGQAYFFGVLFLCLVASFVVFLSNFLTMSANVTLTILMYFAISGFSDSLRETILFSKGLAAAGLSILYYLLPHFDFFDLRIRITHQWDPLPAWVVIAVTFYTLVYCSVLLYFSGRIFERKKF